MKQMFFVVRLRFRCSAIDNSADKNPSHIDVLSIVSMFKYFRSIDAKVVKKLSLIDLT